MNIRIIRGVLLAGIIAMLFSSAYGRDARGILIVMPYAGADRPKAISFSDIKWNTAASLVLTDPSGTTSSFNNDLVVNILYLDSDYLHSIGLDETQTPYRSEISRKEVDVGTLSQNLTLDVELGRLNEALKRVSDIITKYPSLTDLLDPVRTDINAEVARYQKGDRKDKGKWYSADDYKAHLIELNKHKGLSLTTKSGVKYDDIVLGDAVKEGITITFPSGVATIRVEDIPDTEHLTGWSDEMLDKLDALKQQVEQLNYVKPSSPVATKDAPKKEDDKDDEKDMPTIRLTTNPPPSNSATPGNKSP